MKLTIVNTNVFLPSFFFLHAFFFVESIVNILSSCLGNIFAFAYGCSGATAVAHKAPGNKATNQNTQKQSNMWWRLEEKVKTSFYASTKANFGQQRYLLPHSLFGQTILLGSAYHTSIVTLFLC